MFDSSPISIGPTPEVVLFHGFFWPVPSVACHHRALPGNVERERERETERACVLMAFASDGLLQS